MIGPYQADPQSQAASDVTILDISGGRGKNHSSFTGISDMLTPMNKFVLLSGVGIGCAVLIGVGVSVAHTNGVFGPTEPDWLEVGQMMPVVVPESVPDVVAAPNTVQTSDVIAALAPAPAIVAPVEVQTYAPLASLVPMTRPSAGVVAVLAPVAPAPLIEVAPSAPVARAVPAPAPFLPSEDIQNRAKTPSEFESTPGFQQSLVAAPNAPQSTPDPIDNVWLLGVYR